MPNLLQITRQETIEQRYNKRHIDRYIREAIANDITMQQKIVEGVQLVEAYRNQTYYESKNVRIAQLQGLDLVQLVTDIFVGIAYCIREELFTSVTAQLAGRLGFSDRVDAIKTVAELVAVLCQTDVFDINKADKMASLVVKSNLQLDDWLLEYISHSQYLPPMVCMPLELTDNYSSGYLTHKDSLILGKGNHHEGDLCLDVLNLMNAVPLQLNTRFLCTLEEEPTFDLDTPEKVQQWNNFKEQSYAFYKLMMDNGNTFHMTHKVDKRGRTYAQGYHINPMGTAFKKAMIELADEELVEGVPHG